MKFSPKAALAGRKAMAKRCQRIAAKYTPKGVKVIYRAKLSGRAYLRRGELHAPKPVTRKSLYIFLCVCAYFHLSHLPSQMPVYVRVMHSSKWAHFIMRQEGIAVPRSMTKRAKSGIAHLIRKDLKRGAQRIDPEAAKFAGVRIRGT